MKIIMRYLAFLVTIFLVAACGGQSSSFPASAKISVTDTVNPKDDSLVSFGTVAAGYSSMEAVVVTNNGNANLIIGQIASNDPLAAPFSVALDTCSGVTLAPDSKCDILLRFAPISSGTFTDTFDIPSNDPDHAETVVGVIGTGTFAVPVPHIVVTDSVPPSTDQILAFGTLNMSTASTRTVTIGNDGSVNLVIGQIGQALVLTGPFTITDTCSGQSIAPAQTCDFTVQFHPVGTGTFSGGFDIPSNDPGGSVLVGVVGTGVDLLSPVRLDFGNVLANLTSDQTVTVTNNGAADIVIGQIANLDPLAAPFSITGDGCSIVTLAPTGSCQVTVRFAPVSSGTYSNTFDIPTTGDVIGDFIIPVSGTAGSGSVSGTVTMPAPATGKCYAVVLATSFSIVNPLQNGIAVATGQTNGTATFTYSLTNIPPGTYFLYAGVDNNANSAIAPGCTFTNGTIDSGDYAGFYGGPSANAIVTVGTNTFDFSLSTF
jgi:hypothetical protein